MTDLPESHPINGDAARASTRELSIQFTGSGSEYFRIWIVNLLLIIVTLGLYIPFAKARRIRYFYANTLVDGQALAFHGDPWRMFRGFVLMLVLMGAYSASGRISPFAAFFAFLVLCAIWPALWRSSMRFRLGNTSWRGLRFAFRGDLAGAYKSLLPVYLPLIPVVVMPLLMGRQRPEQLPIWFSLVYIGILLGELFLWPWGLALIKRYQHRGYSLGAENAEISLGVGSIYGLVFKAIGMCLGIGVVAGIVAAVAVGAGASFDPKGGNLAFIALIMLLYLGMIIVIGPWAVARLQNLVWGGTYSRHLTFKSTLSARSYTWLCIKNWLLTVVTLGLYRPFAVISFARMRVQAVSVALIGGFESFSAAADAAYQDATGDATGDASGDFFGIDLGL